MSGTWARRYTAPTQVPVQSPLDPEHLNPTRDVDQPGGKLAPWQSTVAAPDLPAQLLPGSFGHQLDTGLGPVDHTPDDPNYGVGSLPGVTQDEAQDTVLPWHTEDYGAVAAQQWVATVDRDGQPRLEVMHNEPGHGDSPGQVVHESTGVGAVTDQGNSRRGRREKRWYDRYIDFHRWDVSMGPSGTQYARGPSARTAVSSGGPNVSPYGNSVAYSAGPADRFVAPLERRVPGAWDAPLNTDGIQQTVAGATTQYGLTQWGL